MKRELKRQIKQDELLTGVEQLVRFVGAHGNETRVTAIVVAVLLVAAGGLAYFQGRRIRDAEAVFGEALAIFHAPVAGEEAGKPGGPAFATEAEKYRKAAAAFDGVERRFASLPVGVRARYYGALCRIEMGELKEARRALTDVAARKDGEGLDSALARLALAEVEWRDGQMDRAIEAYRRLIEDTAFPLPRDHVLMVLASTLEEGRRLAEARAAYRRLAEEFPGSAYAPEATRRAEYLRGAGQAG